MKRKKWIAILTVLLVLGGVALVAAKSKEKGDSKEESSPFRLGKVQAEDLQVSVREVGVVDPEIKVDVKSAGLRPRPRALTCARATSCAPGDVLAEVEPDVNQAQSLSDVQAARHARPSSSCGRRARARDAEGALRRRPDRPATRCATSQISARPGRRQRCAQRQSRYQIVEDRGIPISGNASHARRRGSRRRWPASSSPRASSSARRVTSGVSSFNEGTVLFTVADLKSLHHPRQPQRGRHRQGARRPAGAGHARRLSAEDLRRQGALRRAGRQARREDQGLRGRGRARRARRRPSAPA